MTAAATASASSVRLDYVGECVRFAREASGIDIHGDAWTWWSQAEGRYDRGSRPKIGAVVVFARSARLPLGHVAVVSRLVERRVAMLTHANWSRIGGVRGHAEQDVTLFDVSTANDWSAVRVWYRDNAGLGGSVYPLAGFIYARSRPAKGLSGQAPDDVAALIDAYEADGVVPTSAALVPSRRVQTLRSRGYLETASADALRRSGLPPGRAPTVRRPTEVKTIPVIAHPIPSAGERDRAPASTAGSGT